MDILIAKETLAAKPLVKELLERIGIVEMARQERRLYVAAERRIRRERSTRDQGQLTELTYAFVDKLYHEYRVDGSALSSLTDEDYTRMAAIVLARHRHAVPEAYEGEA